jgi:iron donor protein CyaY
MTMGKVTSDTMDETMFRALAGDVVTRVRQALDEQDPDVVECVPEADVVKIAFPTGLPFVLNLQRPVREVWFAAERQAWHFRFDGEQWTDKRTHEELCATIVRLVQARSGVHLRL